MFCHLILVIQELVLLLTVKLFELEVMLEIRVHGNWAIDLVLRLHLIMVIHL